MSGYTKNIAVIKQLKEGFSADSSPLSGLVKCEKYGSRLKVEITKINFAPLTEGRFVCGISDGKNVIIFEEDRYEGASSLDTGAGFAVLICFVNASVSPVATAVCGPFASAAFMIKEHIERAENLKKKGNETAYEDEAIAEVNYYDYATTDEDGGAVRKDKAEQEKGPEPEKNEDSFGSVKKMLSSGGGIFYERLKGEIEGLLKSYPHESALEEIVENSKWVKITYDGEEYYVFGVIYADKTPRYVCYGVPAKSPDPPESMQGLASLIPLSEGGTAGYWVMYQDASSGAPIKVSAE